MDQLARLKTTSSIHAALDSLPRGLYGTYNRILDGILPENELLAVRALRWLAHAAVPLSLCELLEAIAVEEESSSLDSLQKLLIPEDVFQICGSLVRRSDQTGMLSLAHTSVFEYLTGASLRCHPPVPYYMPTAPSRIVLAKTCLTYLSFEDFNKTLMQTKMGHDLDGESTLDMFTIESSPERAFFDYALRNWWKHLPTSQEDLDELWPQLVGIFDTESGNFVSSIMLLHHLEGTYKCPLTMQPIHFCASHGLDLICYRLLSNADTDVECKVKDGRTALHMAAENGHENVVQHLLTYDAEANARSADGRTPLQFALDCGNESIIQLLFHGGADVNDNFASGETPLSVAVGNRWASLVQRLLREKADPNRCLPDGRTSLHIATQIGSDIGIVEMLCDYGPDLKLRDKGSWTALHYAAHHGHTQAVRMLMKDKVNIDIFKEAGWTPLHAALEQQHTDIVKLLSRFAKLVSESLTRNIVALPRATVSRPMPDSLKVED